MGLIHITPVSRRRHGSYDNPAQSRRQGTVWYTVPNGKGELVNICKTTFAGIFALGHKRLQILIGKKKSGDLSFTDKRTRHYPGTLTDEDMSNVRNHINDFPRESSHYSRARSSKEYLSPDLNVARMHSHYKMMYPQSTVSYMSYRKVVLRDFPHLSFQRPRKDTCKMCDRLNIEVKAGTPESKSAKIRQELHHRKSEKARTLLKSDIAASQLPGSNTCCVSIDLEQVMFVPTLTHSEMFYRRQLSCYNFGISLGDTHHSYMCMWDETVAGRGGNEIASCLLKVLNSEVTKKTRLIVWSDNCVGQNKNRMMVFLFLFLVSIGLFKHIEQRFLVSGHSFLPCDSDFALIEKRKRVSKAFIPSDLHKIVRDARINKPFKVIPMYPSDFLDFQTTADNIISTKSLNISKAVSIEYDCADVSRVGLKESHSELETCRNIKVLRKGRTETDLRNATIEVITSERRRLTTEKMNDLKAMIPYLEKEEHKAYYRNLCGD